DRGSRREGTAEEREWSCLFLGSCVWCDSAVLHEYTMRRGPSTACRDTPTSRRRDRPGASPDGAEALCLGTYSHERGGDAPGWRDRRRYLRADQAEADRDQAEMGARRQAADRRTVEPREAQTAARPARG